MGTFQDFLFGDCGSHLLGLRTAGMALFAVGAQIALDGARCYSFEVVGVY